MSSDNKLNKENNLARQDYWDNSYENYQFAISPPNDKVRQWIEQYISPVKDKTCFEIGCFPGRYLSVLGQLGYELNGIDLTPRIESDLAIWLQKCNFKVGNISMANVFDYNTSKQFDLVCSFGFIEHFKNWEDVLKIHAELVKKDGLLLLETPNFRGLIQQIIHYILDYENIKRHYLPVMNPYKWKRILEPLGFEIIYCNYFHEFQYWLDKQPQGFFRRKFLQALIKMESRMKLWSPDNALYSPYCGLIARKK